jgi:hypothetical protein
MKILPMLPEQFCMGTGFSHLAILHQQDRVRTIDGRQAVCNQDHPALCAQAQCNLLEQRLLFGVEVSGRFIHYEQWGIFEKGTRQRQPLRLSTT